MCPVQVFRGRLQLNVYLNHRYVFGYTLVQTGTVCLQYASVDRSNCWNAGYATFIGLNDS